MSRRGSSESQRLRVFPQPAKRSDAPTLTYDPSAGRDERSLGVARDGEPSRTALAPEAPAKSGTVRPYPCYPAGKLSELNRRALAGGKNRPDALGGFRFKSSRSRRWAEAHHGEKKRADASRVALHRPVQGGAAVPLCGMSMASPWLSTLRDNPSFSPQRRGNLKTKGLFSASQRLGGKDSNPHCSCRPGPQSIGPGGPEEAPQ